MKKFLRIFFPISIIIFLALTVSDSRSEYNVAACANSVCAGDLDLDGNVDIVVGNTFNFRTNWGGLSFLNNLGCGSFNFTDSVYFYAWEYVIMGQLDLDPHPEIIFQKDNLETEFIAIIFNNDLNDSLFLDTQIYSGISSVACGDVDNNGFNDIIFASNQGQLWGIFYNYGNKNFSPPEIHNVTGYYPTGLACGDLNNDGRDDIVICGQIIDVYLSYSSGFLNMQLYANGFKSDVAIADFDLDGDNDILTVSAVPLVWITDLIIYRNNGNNSFYKLPNFTFQPASGSFFITDFNNDSLPDILFGVEGGYILYYNQGDFELADSQFVSIPTYGPSWIDFYCSDFDNNGFMDIVTTRFYSLPLPANVDIRFNDGNGNFGPDPIVGNINTEKVKKISLRNYPNPFHIETTFEFELKESAYVKLSIFDSQGNLILNLANQMLGKGINSIKWDGLDAFAQYCKTGVYIAFLTINNGPSYAIKVIKI